MGNRPTSPSSRQLAFRRFALQGLSLPAVLAENLSTQQSHDFLALSIGSFQDHLRLTDGLRRQSGHPFVVQVGYLDSNSPNARAATREGIHLIAMHVGLAAAAFEFSLFCLSQSTVLSHIGDAALESSPLPVDGYPPGFWMREAGARLNEDDFMAVAKPLIPRDPRRYEAAILLTVLMTRFVWFHELYHHVNGHSGLVEDAQGLPLGFEESDATAAGDVSADALRLFELDADQSALDASLRIISAGIENVEGLRRMSAADVVALTLFAAYSVTWILDEFLFRAGRKPDISHPPPMIRRLNLVRTFASAAAPGLPDARAVHDGVLSEMNALSKALSRFPSRQTVRSEMQNIELQLQLDGMQDDLDALRSALAPYRYI